MGIQVSEVKKSKVSSPDTLNISEDWLKVIAEEKELCERKTFFQKNPELLKIVKYLNDQGMSAYKIVKIFRKKGYQVCQETVRKELFKLKEIDIMEKKI